MDMDMDPIEEAADNMSLDGESDESSDLGDETDDEDWAAVGMDALRQASLPTPNAPVQNYRKMGAPYTGRWTTRPLSRQPSQPPHSASVPVGHTPGAIHPAMQSPAEREAIVALMSMGSM
jgi:hypothetical protein